MLNTDEVVAPDPASLIESIRGFGYSLETAIADLVDNSIAAKADKISVEIELESHPPHIAVTDNGRGMDKSTLIEAMRMGTTGPLTHRSKSDLGRFGLGLKTAAFSQGRILTVISRSTGPDGLVTRCWDLDHVKATGEWRLKSAPGSAASKYASRLETSDGPGTVVVIEELDRVSMSEVPTARRGVHVNTALQKLATHLGVVFHRFMQEDGITLKLGQSAIQPWDPFVRGFSTPVSPVPEKLHVKDDFVYVSASVLPHPTKVDTAVYEKAEGPLGWNRHQGFFVYRCRRLVVAGGWLGLGFRQEPQTKLARIQVDLPNTLDESWQLNVMKSSVVVPPSLRDSLKRIAQDVRRQALRVYGLRGERAAPSETSSIQSVWRRRETSNGISFVVDRSHPVIEALVASSGGNRTMLRGVLKLIEHSIPIAAILQQPSKSLDTTQALELPDNFKDIVDLAYLAINSLVDSGMAPNDARNRVLRCPPFVDVQVPLTEALDNR